LNKQYHDVGVTLDVTSIEVKKQGAIKHLMALDTCIPRIKVLHVPYLLLPIVKYIVNHTYLLNTVAAFLLVPVPLAPGP